MPLRVCFSFVMILMVGAAWASAANIMPNGQFDAEMQQGKISGWSSATQATCTSSSDPTAGSVLRVTHADPKVSLSVMSDAVTIPDATHTLLCSLRLRADRIVGSGTARVLLILRDAAGKTLARLPIDEATTSMPDWRVVRLNASVPAEARHFAIELAFEQVSGQMELDDIVIDTDDFSQLRVAFSGHQRVLGLDAATTITIHASRAGTVQIRDFDDAVVKTVSLACDADTSVELKSLPAGIYWITTVGGVFIDTFAVIPPVSTPSDPDDWRFGVHYAYSEEGANCEPGTFEPKMDILARIGAVWLRCNTRFSDDVENIAWAKRDRFVDAMRSRGLQMLTFFENYNFPAKITSHWTDPLTQAFIGTYVSHYRGKLMYFETWNEANLGSASKIETYAAYHRAFHKTVKEANPSAKVVQTGIATPARLGEWDSIATGPEFQERLLRMKLADVTDVFNYHFYPYQWDTATIVKRYARLYRQYNVTQPVWVTENGFAAPIADLALQREQAAYLVRSAVTTLSLGVSRYFWFLAMDHPAFKYGLIDESDRPKAACVAYATMANLLGQASHVGRASLSNKDVVANVFEDTSRRIVVLWSVKSPTSVSVRAVVGAGASGTVVDIMGRTKTLAADDRLTLTAMPIFVVTHKATSLPACP